MQTKSSELRPSGLDRLADFLFDYDPVRQLRRIRGRLAGRSFQDDLRKAAMGRRVLVTGASSGIGRGVALELLKVGATVLLVARRQDMLEEVAEAAKGLEGKAYIYVADLAKEEDRLRLFQEVVADHGGVDILINNAGRSIRRRMYDSVERMHDYERVMAINYYGAIGLSIPLADQMRRTGSGGHIINISTMGTQLKGTPRFGAYIASKRALDGFTESVAAETFNDGIIWTTVHLPLTQTDMIAPAQSAWNSHPKLSLRAGIDMVLDAIAYAPPRVVHPMGFALELADRYATQKLLNFKAREFPPAKEPKKYPRVIIIGAGMSGIAMAKRLQEAGATDFTVYEKADSVGGTWRDNTYPGLTCDVPAHYYCYKDELSAHWSHVFAPGEEIRDYFERVTDTRGLKRYIRFNSEIVEAKYADGIWTVKTASGETDEAEVLVCATGVLHHPYTPDIKGLDQFAGPSFHSARWDHSVELDGKRVGIIGNGSTGVQIVTALAKRCSQVSLFQRTPQWVFTAPNPKIPKPLRKLSAAFPPIQRLNYVAAEKLFSSLFRAPIENGWQRRLFDMGARHSLASVRDASLRSRVTPDYEPMCKRMVTSPGFYKAIQQSNVDIVTDKIDHVEAKGVVTADGKLHELDVLVLATGFKAHAYMRPMQIMGEKGKTLDEAWQQGPTAYNTVMIPGFPNLFTIMGPNSPIGNASLVPIAEAQADHIIYWLDRMQRENLESIEPTEAATERFYGEVNNAFDGTVWVSGCNSWYLTDDGRPVLWPWPIEELRKRLDNVRDSDFIITSKTKRLPDNRD